MLKEPSFSIGIEEEYLLTEQDSFDLSQNPSSDFLKDCQNDLGKRVSPEFLRCQIEVGSPVCHTIDDLREEMITLRRTIHKHARHHGLFPVAASTHPFAKWKSQKHTDKERYNELAEDLKIVAQRLMICGMHVHIGIEDEALRFDIFNQLRYFLPHLLALSTSSPFWQGRQTGLKSYRLSVFDELPRTGLPEVFASPGEYNRTIDVLVKAGLIEDGTKIWWDLRPSSRYPTLEMRITDVCTHLEDALCIAALMRCLCRMLYRLRVRNQRWRSYSTFLLQQNRWLAQKDGISKGLVDFGQGACVPFSQLMDELLDLIEEDANALNCLRNIHHVPVILQKGTSADQQLALYQEQCDTLSSSEALRAVTRNLTEKTIEF
jgi:carboxylate-amine ligase